MKSVIKADFVVVGGGSGGVAAALSAARVRPEGSVILIEKNNILGGTSTIGGVNNWEPGIGGMAGLHQEIAVRLLAVPDVACVAKGAHGATREEPWGDSAPVSNCYDDSLRRSGLSKGGSVRFHFEPMAMALVMSDLLADAGVKVMTNTLLMDARTARNRIVSVSCMTPQGLIEIEADHFADCTADIVLCRMAGCDAAIGEDPASMFHEDGAPEQASRRLNGATLVFRITPCEKGYRDPVPHWVRRTEAAQWIQSGMTPVSCLNFYPCGDAFINMLPTLDGEAYWWGDPVERMREATARVLLYWHEWQKTYSAFDGYRLRYIFPEMGVRESWRLRGRYILSANDLFASYLNQPKREEIVAFGDHAVDVHGNKHRPLREMKLPYGIPYSSLLPREYDNLIVACRGASFSHIAGASCRLSRNMLALGEAAGTAAALLGSGEGFSQVDMEDLRSRLKIRQTEDMIAERWAL